MVQKNKVSSEKISSVMCIQIQLGLTRIDQNWTSRKCNDIQETVCDCANMHYGVQVCINTSKVQYYQLYTKQHNMHDT